MTSFPTNPNQITETPMSYRTRTIGEFLTLRTTFDLSATEAMSVLILLDHEKLTMSELADEVSLSRAAMTTLTDRLEIAGLVERRIPKLDEGDRRRIHLVVPEKARRRVESAIGEVVSLAMDAAVA